MMRPLPIHQLSPQMRQLVKQHLMAHAMRAHQQMQMRSPMQAPMHTPPMALAGAGPAPGITSPGLPMLGGMMPPGGGMPQ